jgi:transcriptional regulator with XRE-family HTH domain
MPAMTLRYKDVKEAAMKNPDLRRAYEELEPAYQLIRLRIMRGLTQQEMAERVGTTQSSIARLEGGKVKRSLSFIERVVAALDGRVIVSIKPTSAVEP